MPIDNFLSGLSRDFSDQSPVRIIIENETGEFLYTPPQDFPAQFLEEDDEFLTPANLPLPVEMILDEVYKKTLK